MNVASLAMAFEADPFWRERLLPFIEGGIRELESDFWDSDDAEREHDLKIRVRERRAMLDEIETYIANSKQGTRK